jgi:hypothetical protein
MSTRGKCLLGLLLAFTLAACRLSTVDALQGGDSQADDGGGMPDDGRDASPPVDAMADGGRDSGVHDASDPWDAFDAGDARAQDGTPADAGVDATAPEPMVDAGDGGSDGGPSAFRCPTRGTYLVCDDFEYEPLVDAGGDPAGDWSWIAPLPYNPASAGIAADAPERGADRAFRSTIGPAEGRRGG